MNSLSGGLSTLHCETIDLINSMLIGTCNSCDCNNHTTDPGEMGPCTETVK